MASASLAPVDTFCASCPGKEIKSGLLLIVPLDNAIKAKDSWRGPRPSVPPRIYNASSERLERQNCFHYRRRAPFRPGNSAGHGAGGGQRRLYFPIVGQ